MAFWSRAGKRNEHAPTYTRNKVTLFSDETPELSRSITMSLDASGALKLEGQDVGPRVKEMLGDSDYEFALSLTPENAGALCFALLQEKLSGRVDAVDALRELCKENGIESEFWNWM